MKSVACWQDLEPYGFVTLTGEALLSREMMVPLAVFALLESGCTEVLCLPRRAIGIEPTDSAELAAALKDRHEPDRVLRYSGTAGDRNVHLMSGRVT